MGNVITFDSGRHLTKNQIIDVLRITNLLPELASKVLDKIIQGEYTTVSRMENILDELKLPTPKKHEILEEMRLTYKAIKEQEKRNRIGGHGSSVMSLNGSSNKSSNEIEILRQETSKKFEEQEKINKDKDKEIKEQNKKIEVLEKDGKNKDIKIEKLEKDKEKSDKRFDTKLREAVKEAEGFTMQQRENVEILIKSENYELTKRVESLENELTKVTKERDDLLVEKLDLIKKNNLKADDGLLSKEISLQLLNEKLLELEEQKKQIKEARDNKITEKSSARAEYIKKKAELSQQVYELEKIKKNFQRIDEINNQIAQCDSKITELNTRIANIDAKGQELLNEKDKEIKEYQEKKSKLERMEFDYIPIPDNLILMSSSRDNPITNGVN